MSYKAKRNVRVWVPKLPLERMRTHLENTTDRRWTMQETVAWAIRQALRDIAEPVYVVGMPRYKGPDAEADLVEVCWICREFKLSDRDKTPPDEPWACPQCRGD